MNSRMIAIAAAVALAAVATSPTSATQPAGSGPTPDNAEGLGWHGFARLPGATWKTWLINSTDQPLYVDRCWWVGQAERIECDRTFPDGQTKRITYHVEGDTVVLEGVLKDPVVYRFEPDGTAVSSREAVQGDLLSDRSYFYWPEMILTDVSSRSFKGRILTAVDSYPGQADSIFVKHTRDYNAAGGPNGPRTYSMEEVLAHMRAEAEAENAEFEAHIESMGGYGNSNADADVVGGFMRGMAEATQDNQAMEQSMEYARDVGLAQGAWEYDRRQAEQDRRHAAIRQADIEHARRVREAEEAARVARASSQGGIPAETPLAPGNGSGTVGVQAPEPAILAAPSQRQCRYETASETARSIPLADQGRAEAHVRDQHCARGDLRPVAMGPISCTSESEPILERGGSGGVQVTGHRTMYTCEATRSCRVEVCEAPAPESGASKQ